MKTSTKVGLTLLAALVLAGLVIAAFKPAQADGDASPSVDVSATENAPTPTESTSAAEPTLTPTLPHSLPRGNTWKLVIDEEMLSEHPNTFACTFYARDPEWMFLDYIPIGTILDVTGNSYCSGYFEIEFRIWVSADNDVSELEAQYDVVLRYPTELGYGYLLGRRAA